MTNPHLPESNAILTFVILFIQPSHPAQGRLSSLQYPHGKMHSLDAPRPTMSRQMPQGREGFSCWNRSRSLPMYRTPIFLSYLLRKNTPLKSLRYFQALHQPVPPPLLRKKEQMSPLAPRLSGEQTVLLYYLHYPCHCFGSRRQSKQRENADH